MELQHKQADGPGDEDHPPHQQGGDGEFLTEHWSKLELDLVQVHKTLGAGAVAAAE